VSFAHPWWLVAGVAIAFGFAVLVARGMQRGREALLTYSDVPFLTSATGSRFDPALAVAASTALAIVACGAALAGPRATVAVPVAGAVILCVDTSGSMRATDVAPSRADAAAAAVGAFIDAVPAGTRVGIVAFAGAAGVIAAPTLDKDALHDAVAGIPPPNGGTAIGDALVTAARQLPADGRRAIVLITDGVNNAGADPAAVAPQLGATGIEIDTVGIGTNGSGRLIPGTTEEAALDEDALRQIAADAHGVYARADDAGTLRSRLAALAHTTTREERRLDLSFPLALAAAFVLAATVAAGMLAGRFP
jgi:Ca-activated chloride channel family protein